MKRLFYLTMTMSVFIYPLFFASCEEEDTNEDVKKEQTNTQNQTYDIPPGVFVSSIKAYTGDNYVIENEELGITGVSLSVVRIEDSFITLSITGNTITICDSKEYMSCVLYDEKNKNYVEATLADAKSNPEKVLLVCQNGSFLVSGTEAYATEISGRASKTYFKKWDYLY